MDFNTFWSNCVCGSDGAPVSDGPFYMSNYTKGQGLTLKANPNWYGAKPKLKEVDFKIITDTNSEIQAMRGGEVDAINPSPQTALSELKGQSGLVYSAVTAFYQEHIDIQFGPKSNPLLHAPWFRHAMMMGMDRPSLIKALYSQLAPGMKPLNNLEYMVGPGAIPHFATGTSARRRRVALLAQHCTGGPSDAGSQQHGDLDVRRPEGGAQVRDDGGQPAPRDEHGDLDAAAEVDRHPARREHRAVDDAVRHGPAEPQLRPRRVRVGRRRRIRRASTRSGAAAVTRTTRATATAR